MKLKKIIIENYKQFARGEINLEDDLTVLAGANNSGKTSLVEYFKKVFYDNSFISKDFLDDLPVKEKTQFMVDLFSQIQKSFEEKDDAKLYDQIRKEFDNNLVGDKEVKKFEHFKLPSVSLEVTYADTDDITDFSDYLMETDETISSFYFMNTYKFNVNNFMKLLENDYYSLKEQFASLKQVGNDINQRLISESIFYFYISSFSEVSYFTDKTFTNRIELSNTVFKSLFNYKHITANRKIETVKNESKNSIADGMVDLIDREDKWTKQIKKLSVAIESLVKNEKIAAALKDDSGNKINKLLGEIAKTSNQKLGEIELDIQLDADSVIEFLKKVTSANYIIEGQRLCEASQGLGYSNLIYMHLQLELYIKRIDNNKVNIFIIEEPESHMHPQMQKVFTSFLFSYYKDNNMQGLITTHSAEIVRATVIEKIRVIRQLKLFENAIYDMRAFNEDLRKTDENLLLIYSLLYQINFADIVFADKIIMYEGDTERMYINSLLLGADFKSLSDQYISYVQVGGAYAHKYNKLIEFLKIKTLIFTDIDYEANCETIEQIKASTTTNAAIISFYRKLMDMKQKKQAADGIVANAVVENKELQNVSEKEVDKPTTINQILSLLRECKWTIGDYICIKCQTEKDFFARTLEEAMLAKYFGMNVNDNKTHKFWEEKRRIGKLNFPIPRNKTDPNKESDQLNECISIRDIVKSTENKKTDFMYSVILNKLTDDTMPNYIKEGLQWLSK